MTDRTRAVGPGEHLGAETLADLQEGLLEPGPARAAEEHLSTCAACAADDRVLAGIPGLLAAAGDAGPVPGDVAHRLDEALAAEPPVLTGGGGAATVTPLASRRRAPAGMRVLQAAAVLVVVLAGLGIALSAQLGGNDAQTSAGSAADTATKALPDDGSFPVTTSGRNWTQDSVVTAVPELLAGSIGPSAPSAATPEPDEPDGRAGAESGGTARDLAGTDAARLAGGPALAECVTALNDDPVTPLAIDLATWQGNPAAVVVLPTPGDPSSVDVWVVAPDCSLADAKVLNFARVARP